MTRAYARLTKALPLATRFLATVEPTLRDDPSFEPAEVERLLDAAYEQGRVAWSGIEVPADAFVEHVAGRLRSWQDLPVLHFVDLYLALGCARGDERALAVLDRQLLGELDHGLRRLGMSSEGAAELKQLLRVALFAPATERRPEILDYSGRGSLRGWLRVMAARRARRSLKKERLRGFVGDEALLDVLDPREDPALALMKSAHREHCADAVKEALTRLSTQERTLLRHQLVDGLSIDEIGARYGVHRATAARWVVAARDRLGAEARAVLKERFSLDTVEVDSLVRFVESRVHVSLVRLLAGDPGE